MPDYFLGLISGTSMDGVDAVVASFDEQRVTIHASLTEPYPQPLKEELLLATAEPENCTAAALGSLDRRVGECFRDAAMRVMAEAGVAAGDVTAIGSHGQTVRHEPDASTPYTLQIGDPATVALGIGVTTVADFRRADIAAGGQGAPLTPPFHEWLFASPDVDRAVVNIGGIANVTMLPAGGPVTGFDTGPGNTLLDGWTRLHRHEAFDRNGDWAAQGTVINKLLDELLAFDYFGRQPPKSTGFEVFNLDWLRARGVEHHDPTDVQATLCELTARTIADDVRRYQPATLELFVCGGGAHNADMLRRLGRHLPETKIDMTAAAGLDPDLVEAAAFAWLAMRTVNGKTGNLPTVTGASRKVVLGAIHYASK